MPAISMFYGIIIYMYYFDNKEHKTPHIHANYAEYDAVISIPDGDVIKGEMPNNKLKFNTINLRGEAPSDGSGSCLRRRSGAEPSSLAAEGGSCFAP